MALVTGAARGLGYAIALALGRAGAKVVVNDLSAQACDAACERLNAAGIPARGAPFDVADGEAVAAALRELEAAGWAPDVLVSNAGNQNHKPVVEMTPAEWRGAAERARQRRFQLRPRGMPGMVRRGFGRIVLMSSVAGQATMPNIAAYATAKGAIAAFARALAVGIRRQRHHLQRAGAGLRAHRLHAGAAGQSAVPVLPVHGGAGRTLGRAGRYRAGGGVPGRAGAA